MTDNSRGLVRGVIWAWDPLGLQGEDGAADEYDGLISQLAGMHAANRAASEMAAWLLRELVENWGMSDTERLREQVRVATQRIDTN